MKTTYLKRTGHERYKNVHKSLNSAATDRRRTALAYLEDQLKNIPPELERDKNTLRIIKEVAKLKERIQLSGLNLYV